jgi:pyrimidine operon attenuation protein/uracil phosphoribosyltransferase
MKKSVILEERDISEIVQKLAEKVVSNNPAMSETVLVGIRTGGAHLAARLRKAIGGLTQTEPPLGLLDITLYRDDWTRIGPTPVVRKTELPFSIDGRNVVLVDDVLFTGRTVRAAMDALMDYGRPRRIELAVLVDRGNGARELPIMANYTGGVWSIEPNQTVNVYLSESGYPDHVAIEEKGSV